MSPAQLGHVPSLFPHIKDEWWKDSYSEVFLWTDGDCVENPALTDAECTTLFQIPRVRALFAPSDVKASVKVLDLCCGQGRHANNLAARFPSAQFHGIDQSTYLLDLARERARTENVTKNTHYTPGDARSIPAPNESYDLVLLLGNSFGHGSQADDVQLLRETARVLKRGGIFVIDFVDGGWMRENALGSGWEWLGHEHFTQEAEELLRHGEKKERKKLIALRERELSPDKKRLASREIVVDLAAPRVYQDLFYAVQLYDMADMEGLFGEVGLGLLPEEGMRITAPMSASGGGSDGAAGDQGMMGHRQLLVAWKPGSSTSTFAGCLDPQDADTYVHPHITLDYEEGKGRLLRATGLIAAGTVVIADAPYAIVPTVPPDSNEALVCSNLLCRRRVVQDTEGVRCVNNCIRDVIWCDIYCQRTDQARHDFECAWLKKYGTRLRQEEGEEDYAMLWIIVRMLAGRDLELKFRSTNPDLQQDKLNLPWSDRFKRGWEAGIDGLLGNRERWPQERLQHWADLVERYLSDEGQPGLLSADEILTLICKEETNTFGLYAVNTGPPEIQQERGPSYGLACYPRATTCNHSCLPNLKHGPDDRGRMVMTATRDIASGEECFIAYIDLSVHSSLEARQKRIMHYFTFSCVCDRCLNEAELDV